LSIAERALYHQGHPLKLATDSASTLAAIPFLWNGDLLLGVAIALLPPAIVSLWLVATADLAPIRDSALGRYLRRHMGPIPQAMRLIAGLGMLAGAWTHSPLTMTVAVGAIAAIWLNGVMGKT